MCRRGDPSLQLRGQAHWQDGIGRRAEAEATCLYACADEEVLLFN